MSCKWNEMTNLPNRDDREAKIYYCGPRAVENLLLLKKWFRWLSPQSAPQAKALLPCLRAGWCSSGCRNFHHQDWPSLRDNDRHHVVAPPSTHTRYILWWFRVKLFQVDQKEAVRLACFGNEPQFPCFALVVVVVAADISIIKIGLVTW